MENILEVTNLTKHYPGFSLNNVSFTLKRGFIMGFIGPNGAGKSTTIKLIMNLMKKDKGNIHLFGLDHLKHELEVKERIGFVYDENVFYEELTVKEMKNIIRPFYRRWNEETFQYYVKQFDLPLTKQIKHLSKGMKMKLSLAIALSHEAELLIMDEPTSGLDPIVRSEILDILQHIMEDERKGVFFSSHITSDLDKIADFITFIHKGEIVFSKSKEELMDDYCVIKGKKEQKPMIENESIVGVRETDFGFEAMTNKKADFIKKFGDAFIYETPNIEEIMLFSVKGGKEIVSTY